MKASMRAAVLGVSILGSFCVPAHAVCDRFAAQNDNALALRKAKNFTAALAIVNQTLKQDPNNIRANYTLGLIYTDMSGIDNLAPPKDLKLAKQGTDQLIRTVGLLASADPQCAQTGNWYSVFNSTGYELLNAGQSTEAEKYLQMGYAKISFLNPASKQKLLNSLGRVYAAQHNYALSARYYGEARSAGAPNAVGNVATTKELSALFKPANRTLSSKAQN